MAANVYLIASFDVANNRKRDRMLHRLSPGWAASTRQIAGITNPQLIALVVQMMPARLVVTISCFSNRFAKV